MGDGPRARAGRDRGGGRVAGVGAAARVTAPVVLGHSFGGGLAKELAYRAPERARRLVLCATWPGLGGTPPRPMAALMLAGQLSATAGWSSLPWLHRVSEPALVAAGEDDPSVPLRNGRVLAARLPDARLHVVKGGGHLFLLDEPESVAGVIRDFVDAP